MPADDPLPAPAIDKDAADRADGLPHALIAPDPQHPAEDPDDPLDGQPPAPKHDNPLLAPHQNLLAPPIEADHMAFDWPVCDPVQPVVGQQVDHEVRGGQRRQQVP